MNVSKTQIDNFLNNSPIAIAGVSRNEKKFGHMVFKELAKKGYDVLPINPKAEQIDSIKCFSSVEDLPENIDRLLIMTPKTETDELLRNAFKKGIKNIWIQQMSETKETLAIAQENNTRIIHGKCIFMFAEPTNGIHMFHKSIMKFFGQLPK